MHKLHDVITLLVGEKMWRVLERSLQLAMQVQLLGKAHKDSDHVIH